MINRCKKRMSRAEKIRENDLYKLDPLVDANANNTDLKSLADILLNDSDDSCNSVDPAETADSITNDDDYYSVDYKEFTTSTNINDAIIKDFKYINSTIFIQNNTNDLDLSISRKPITTNEINILNTPIKKNTSLDRELVSNQKVQRVKMQTKIALHGKRIFEKYCLNIHKSG
jgi:hypothetical protein